MTKTQPPADDLVERLRILREQGRLHGAEPKWLLTLDEAAAELTRLRAMCDELAGAVGLLIEAATVEVNEKGAGGYMLARLSDARTAYAKYQSMEGGGL